ncbi:MAG TPA: HAMP domain-containing sensor histidine kinase [Chitinophagaceae bacterium]|nr:HAMP domain-containing sensor histidine kinase [Chitinophagaceae bacterium]
MLFTLLVTAILLILNISIYYLTSSETKANFNNRLKSRASNNAQIFAFSGDTSLSMLKRVDQGTLAMMPKKTVAIYDTTGRLLYYYQAENADTLVMNNDFVKDIRDAEEKYFPIGKRTAVGLYYDTGYRDFVIIVAADNEEGRQRLLQLKNVLITSLLIGVLATLITGYVFSSQLVKPISGIIREVNAISSRNLSKRLYTGDSKDELTRLAKTFNDLLDRLQDSFNTQKRFISNASHELSTPLTSISSQLQVTLQNNRNESEYRKILRSIQEDVEQMRQLTKGLLEIARAGTEGSIELNDLRIDELLLKVIADIRRINHDYEIIMKFDALPEYEVQCMVFGNFDLLYSAIKNIIENGCKYSPDQTSLVEVNFTGSKIIIHVINKGDILSEEEIQQIFQPFYRGTNAMDVKGFGLGLPLARRILALHRGEIDVTSDISGTHFRISIPSLQQNEPAF